MKREKHLLLALTTSLDLKFEQVAVTTGKKK
jgi:hypothetical protein